MREIRLDHATKLITALHPLPQAMALIEITGLKKHATPIKRYFYDVSIAADFALDVNDQGYSVFVNANPRDKMSGFEADVPYVTALALDLQPERTSLENAYAGLARAGIPPAIVAMSGFGMHMYVFINPAERTAAKLVWERLVRWTGSDAVYNVNRIMRLPGTMNWKKTPPPWCYLVGINLANRFDLDYVKQRLDAAGAPAARSHKPGIEVPQDPDQDWFALRAQLPDSVRDIIATGERNAYSEKQVSRSEADWVVVCALVRAGATDRMIAWVYNNEPVGQLKYHEAGARYLARTIERARTATAEPEKASVSSRGAYQHKRNTPSYSYKRH